MYLVADYFDTGCHHSFHGLALELKLRDEFLDLSGVGFVLNSIVGPSYDSTKNNRLFVVSWSRPESAAYRRLVGFLQGGLNPVQLRFWTGRRDIVPMY